MLPRTLHFHMSTIFLTPGLAAACSLLDVLIKNKCVCETRPINAASGRLSLVLNFRQEVCVGGRKIKREYGLNGSLIFKTLMEKITIY